MTDWRHDIDHWPTPFVGVPLDARNSALVIVDTQRYWTERDGPMGKHLQAEFPDIFDYFYRRLDVTVLPNLARVLSVYRERGFPVVHVTSGSTRDDAKDFAPHLQRRIAAGEQASGAFNLLRVGTEWQRVDAHIEPLPDDLVVNKTTRSAFTSTGLDQLLRNLGVRQLVVGGIATNGCVDLTARDAADLGYETFLIEDGCATYTEEAHMPVLRTFQRVFGTVVTTNEVVAATEEVS